VSTARDTQSAPNYLRRGLIIPAFPRGPAIIPRDNTTAGDVIITLFETRARYRDTNDKPDQPRSLLMPTSSVPPCIIFPRAPHALCGVHVLSVPQILRGQHGLAAARGGANLGLWRSAQRSLCAASLLHRDEAQSRVLQVCCCALYRVIRALYGPSVH